MNDKKNQKSSLDVHLVLRPLTLSDALQPEYVIDHLPATMGRHPSNDIELPFEAVSRFHARLEQDHGKIMLVDLKSSNGTFINGTRVRMAPVGDQDTVIIGRLSFTISTHEKPEQESVDRVGEETSVQFLQHEDQTRAVYQAGLPESKSRIPMLSDERYDETKLRVLGAQLKCFYRLHDLLNTINNEKALFRKALDLLFEVLPADRGVIIIRDNKNISLYRPVAIKTRVGQGGEKININKAILQRSMRERLAILSEAASADGDVNGDTTRPGKNLRTVLCAPMVSVQTVLGFIHLDTANTIRAFNADDLTFLSNIAVEIALHMHNMRMLNDRISSERMAAIGQTITGMAHNIKNILVLSQGGTEMMDKRLHQKNYEALDETWLLVRRSLDRINKLTKDMLDFSRARKVERRRIDLNAFLQELMDSIREAFDRHNVKSQLDLDEQCPPLMLDADGLDKALVNLIVNAIEACEEGDGCICLRTRLNKSGQLLIEVQDNGRGIPLEVQPRIFAPFFTTKGSQGNGLGLAMTRKLIEDMGGRIEMKSTEGVGTCFRITLTIDPTTPAEAEFSDRGEPMQTHDIE